MHALLHERVCDRQPRLGGVDPRTRICGTPRSLGAACPSRIYGHLPTLSPRPVTYVRALYIMCRAVWTVVYLYTALSPEDTGLV
eukprot:scaffold52245_cov40-Phaeocystis_antarctica.AAC.1